MWKTPPPGETGLQLDLLGQVAQHGVGEIDLHRKVARNRSAERGEVERQTDVLEVARHGPHLCQANVAVGIVDRIEARLGLRDSPTARIDSGGEVVGDGLRPRGRRRHRKEEHGKTRHLGKSDSVHGGRGGE